LKDIMDLEEIKRKYNQEMGPIPFLILRGRSEDEQREILLKALETGKEPQFEEGDKIY